MGFFSCGIAGWEGWVRGGPDGAEAEAVWVGARSEASAMEALFEEPLRTLLARRMNLEKPWGRSLPVPPVPEVLMVDRQRC